MIVSQTGRLRDSLRVLLKPCFPQVVIEEAETLTVALQLLAESPRALVLLDAFLPDDQFQQALDWFDSCLVLAHSLTQQRQAQNAGANAVLLDRFTAESLFAAVEAETQDR